MNRISYTALANGFASCSDPDALAAICERFGPNDVQGFFDRWIIRIPTPFTAKDREAGYWWELSMRQVEVSLTLVLDDPRRARRFFEALVADNVGIGRPAEIHAIFGRDRRGRTTAMPFRTRIFGPGTEVKMDFTYKHSRVKQYLKEGRALRIETVFGDQLGQVLEAGQDPDVGWLVDDLGGPPPAPRGVSIRIRDGPPGPAAGMSAPPRPPSVHVAL